MPLELKIKMPRKTGAFFYTIYYYLFIAPVVIVL